MPLIEQSTDDSLTHLAERGYADMAEMRQAIDAQARVIEDLNTVLAVVRRDQHLFEAQTRRQAAELKRLNAAIVHQKDKERDARRRRGQLWTAANSARLMLLGEPARFAKTGSAVDELTLALKHGPQGEELTDGD